MTVLHNAPDPRDRWRKLAYSMIEAAVLFLPQLFLVVLLTRAPDLRRAAAVRWAAVRQMFSASVDEQEIADFRRQISDYDHGRRELG